jgi:hypothetical protein
MSQASRGAVVIDTGVFGARLTLRTRPLATLYEPLIEGARPSYPSSRSPSYGLAPGSRPGGQRDGKALKASWHWQRPCGQDLA